VRHVGHLPRALFCLSLELFKKNFGRRTCTRTWYKSVS